MDAVYDAFYFALLFNTPFTVNEVKNIPEDYSKLIIWLLNSLVILKFNIKLIF